MNHLIYVISLEKDKERREAFKSGFDFLRFDFINAIIGRDLSALEYYKTLISAKGHAKKTISTPSEIGCFLSHKKAIQDFLNSNADFLTIFEDDVIPPKISVNLNKFINEEKLMDDYIYILGGQNEMKFYEIIKPIFGFTKSIKIPRLFNRYIYRTCCYSLTKETARKINEIFKSSYYIADDWKYIINHSNIKGIILYPMLEHPKTLKDSSIELERRLKDK